MAMRTNPSRASEDEQLRREQAGQADLAQNPPPAAPNQPGASGYQPGAPINQPTAVPMNQPMATPVNAPANAAVASPWAALRDRVSWGTVWAGLLCAFTVFLLLELLMFGLGVITTTGNQATAAWVSGVMALLAFFIGGYISEAASALRSGSAGALNGFLVWALGIATILVLSVMGLGQLFGALGSVVGQLIASGRTLPLPGIPPVGGSQAIHVAQSTPLGAFFTLLVTALATIIGGLAGSRDVETRGAGPRAAGPRGTPVARFDRR